MIIKKLTQTIYITRDGKNRAWLELDDFNDSYDAHVSAFISGECVADSIKICSGKQEILLPEVHETCGCSIVMKGQNGLSQCFMCTLKPVKKWRISFINSSHEDLGYEDYVNRLGEGCLRLTKRAMDIIDTYPDFHYSIEHYWWLRSIEQYGDEETFARLRKYFDSGNIDLMFPHCGVHTHWHGYEQLPRSTYYSGLYAGKRWGTRASSVMFADISGMSWSAVAAYADAGVKYVMSLYNSFRDCPDNADMPQCFWWMAPDGRRKVLMWT
ncbi:MAG: hypothetical protein PHG48_09345, partial [Eubacteriales bacterium]|nr:hypothetical protein [Eubacteriales bacterium]